MIIPGFVAAVTAFTPVQAKTWATGDCTRHNGEEFFYAIHEGQGFIVLDNKTRLDVFSSREQRDGMDMGLIRHIGSSANLTLALNLDTGRGYLVVRNDSGRTLEGTVYCVMKSVRR
jgi:hypothetical protein